MPLHRHECNECGNRFRVLVLPGVEDETPTCPVCGSISSHRLMPLVAVQFKGSGFYKTDHGRKGRSRSDKSSSETSSTDPASSDASKASDGPGNKSKTSSDE